MPSLKSIRLPPLPTIRDILKLYKLRAMRQLSQNFIMDQRITDKIVKAAGNINGSHVCEVGPGPGNITRSILQKNPQSLIVVEKDTRFLVPLEMLQESVDIPIRIIRGDVLTLNMESLFPESEIVPWPDKEPNIHLIGNLPFNIATPLIIKWFKKISQRQSAWKYGRVQMTLTFQKEVAERMVAPILSKERCRLSIMAQNWCKVEHKFNIAGKSFVPKPKVDVGVVHFTPFVTPIIDHEFELIEKLTRVLFSSRQKYCIKSLARLFPKCRHDLVIRLLTEANIPQESRAIQLSVQEVGRLCTAYNNILTDYPTIEHYNYREKLDDEESEATNFQDEIELIPLVSKSV